MSEMSREVRENNGLSEERSSKTRSKSLVYQHDCKQVNNVKRYQYFITIYNKNIDMVSKILGVAYIELNSKCDTKILTDYVGELTKTTIERRGTKGL